MLKSLFGIFLLWMAVSARTTYVTAFAPYPPKQQCKQVSYVLHTYFPVRAPCAYASSCLLMAKKNKNKEDSFIDKLRMGLDDDASDIYYPLFRDLDPHPPDYRFQGSTKLPEQVYIVLFSPGTKQQGVHTVLSGKGENVILAFESKGDCDNFACLLKAQEFFDPTPQKVPLRSLTGWFRDTGGLQVQIIPAGVDLVPPAGNARHLGDGGEGEARRKLEEKRDQLDHLFTMTTTDYNMNERTMAWTRPPDYAFNGVAVGAGGGGGGSWQ